MKDLIYFDKKIIKHKYFDFQIGYFTKKYEKTNIFNINIKFSKKTDHAGFEFDLEIWNLYLYFRIYDNRHWCYYCNNWETQM